MTATQTAAAQTTTSQAATRSPSFHALPIREVRSETADAISVVFDVPGALRDAYRFTQGQFLTLKTVIGGEEARRSY